MELESHIRKLGADHRAMLFGVAFTNDAKAAVALARRFIYESGRFIADTDGDAAAVQALYQTGDLIATYRTLPEIQPVGPTPDPEPPAPPPPAPPPPGAGKRVLNFWGMSLLLIFGMLLGALLERGSY